MASFLKNAGLLFLGASALTVATWVFFYFMTPDARLDKDSTFVVFGAWLILIAALQALRRRLSKGKKE